MDNLERISRPHYRVRVYDLQVTLPRRAEYLVNWPWAVRQTYDRS